MLVSESDILCDNFFELNCEFYDYVLWQGLYFDQEEWNVLCCVEGVFVVVVVCLMSGYYDCLIFIVVNVDKFENCLIILMLSIQSLKVYLLFIQV